MVKRSINQEIVIFLLAVMAHVFAVQRGAYLVSVFVHLTTSDVKWVNKKLGFLGKLPTVVARVQHGNVSKEK